VGLNTTESGILSNHHPHGTYIPKKLPEAIDFYSPVNSNTDANLEKGTVSFQINLEDYTL